MHIIILGGGLAGTSTAFLLQQKGHDITIIETEKEIGGVCQTYTYGGINHEFGPHFLYADGKIKSFFQEHLENREYKIFPKVCIGEDPAEVYDFPISFESINTLPEKLRLDIFHEIYHLDHSKSDFSNFENYMLSRMGPTLYELFVKSYNIKQWGLPPSELDVLWARFRPFDIAKLSNGRFGDKWQGHPGDYRPFFKAMTENVTVVQGNVTRLDIDNNVVRGAYFTPPGNGEEKISGDLVISTIPLDRAIPNAPALDFRSTLKLFVILDCESALNHVWTTFPNKYDFLRVFEYKKQSLQKHTQTLLSFSYQYDRTPGNTRDYFRTAKAFIDQFIKAKIIDYKPIARERTYPLPTLTNEKKFTSILKESARLNRFATIGRQGLFSYISMDTCVNQSMTLVDNLEVFTRGSAEEKINVYSQLRKIIS